MFAPRGIVGERAANLLALFAIPLPIFVGVDINWAEDISLEFDLISNLFAILFP